MCVKYNKQKDKRKGFGLKGAKSVLKWHDRALTRQDDMISGLHPSRNVIVESSVRNYNDGRWQMTDSKQKNE
jgi:hypothetical protein